MGRVVEVDTSNSEGISGELSQRILYRPKGDLVGLGDEPDAVVVPVEQDLGGAGRVHRGVVQSGGHRVPEREACLLPISEVVGSLRVDSAGEFEPDLGRVAEVRAVDRLVLDCAVLDDVDQFVDVLMVFRVDLSVEQRGDWGNRGLADVEELVEGEPELVGVVGGSERLDGGVRCDRGTGIGHDEERGVGPLRSLAADKLLARVTPQPLESVG